MRITARQAVAALLLIATMGVVEPASGAPPQRAPELRTLRPGDEVLVSSPIRVNLVMVGYDPSSFDVDQVIDHLPTTSRPVIRAKDRRYGIHDEVGLEHTYEYVPRFAGAAFDDAFFAHLAATGRTGPAGPVAQAYNDQEHNVLDVPSEYLYVDANETERWLEQQAAQRLRVKSTDYTVFLVNWWDRPDFQFHVYQATGAVDPETGSDIGTEWWAELISWGGSTGRSWFLDMSAGPEYYQAGWEIETADITGDGQTDRRLHPVWEYGNTAGYRPFDDLEGDVAMAIRDVAINGLFTASPLFNPTHYLPAPDGARVFDINLLRGDPTQDGVPLIQPDVIRASFEALAPYVETEVEVTERTLTEEERRSVLITSGAVQEDDCWNEFGYRGAQMQCWFGARADQYWPDEAPEDAVVRGLALTLTEEDSWAFGFFGLALDNNIDGTPALFVTNDNAPYRPVWGGHTRKTLHSGGHMLGFWHAIDPYDAASQEYLDPFNGRFYLWLGDAVQSPMSYLFNTTRFGVFDRDNLDRWMVGALLNRANLETEAVLQSPSGGDREVQKLLERADKGFRRSLDEFAKGRWDRAAALAVEAYDDVQRAQARTGTSATTSRAGLRSGDPQVRAANVAAAPPAASPSRHQCFLPPGVDVDPAHLPPGCAFDADGSVSSLYCSLPASAQLPSR